LLDITGKDKDFILPSFKFMAFHDVRAVDFSVTQFTDSHMSMLCNYLQGPNKLYSIRLDKNIFTDIGLKQLAETLKSQKHVCHISLKQCMFITDEGMGELLGAIENHNMTLFHIEFDR
jgi:Ran GTPase-activating protein (RanGAP) involved in mRNA processing and transport